MDVSYNAKASTKHMDASSLHSREDERIVWVAFYGAAIGSHPSYRTGIKENSQKPHASDVCRISFTTHSNLFYQDLADR